MLTLVSYINNEERARRPIESEAKARRLASTVYLTCVKSGRQPNFTLVDENNQLLYTATPRGLRLLWEETLQLA